MNYFRIFCGRPFGYDLCEFDYEALRFGFDLVFDQDLDRRALCHDQFVENIVERFRRNVFVRCNYEQIEPWLKLGINVIVRGDSIPDVQVNHFQKHDKKQIVLLEIYNIDDFDPVCRLALDAIILKGNEAGGRVGLINNFVFLQTALSRCNLPIIVQGGIGKHIIAGLYAAGCAGVLLDHQLALLDESPTSIEARRFIASLQADDFAAIEHQQKAYRFLKRTYSPSFDALAERFTDSHDEQSVSGDNEASIDTYIREHTADTYDDILKPNILVPVGIDLFFARRFSEDFFCFKGLKQGIYRMLSEVSKDLDEDHPFSPGSHFCQQHQIKYPIFQGPMANVSDVAEFAVAVANAGALPFLAVGYLPEKESTQMVHSYRSLAPDKPLGLGLVGIFEAFDGYTKIDDVIKYKPDYVIMAGGFIDYGRRLEKAGIKTYLHTPSEKIFMDTIASEISGVILEGSEAAGHIGKLSSFSLWQACLYALEAKGQQEASKTIILAGGVVGGSAVQFCAGMVSPFQRFRLTFGLQAGSLFLACREAVESAALDARYQDLVLSGTYTVVTGHTVGLPQRQLRTPRVQSIIDWETHHDRSEDYKSIRMEYEAMNRGGLRIAAKSEVFNSESAHDRDAPVFLRLDDEKRYYEDGLFYVGQNVCLLTDRKELPALLEDTFSVATKKASPRRYELDPVCLLQKSKIAIVGVGSYFPDSPSTAHFWRNIQEGTYSITEVPTDLWDPEFYYDSDRSVPNKTYSKIGAFVDESDFNPTIFGILPKVGKDLTRAQKFLLLAAKEAIDRLGLDFWNVDKTKIGVFAGGCFTPELVIGNVPGIQAQKLTLLLKNVPAFPAGSEALINEFRSALIADSRNVTEDTLPNSLNNFLSARVSHSFDFHGPNFTSDAACASSLAAIQNAIDALHEERIDLAVVGAASSSTDFWSYVGFSKVGALSPDLSCPFDRRANGFVMGEGAGIVLLKRLEDAERDGDSVLAVISGIGSSSDGGAKGITAPNPEGQRLALTRAYRNAAMSPATIGFVEAHGTSTILGDQTEFNALTEVYRRHIFRTHVIPIGSVKAQIGHLLGSAGIAGFIKAALCIAQKLKPKSINYESPNHSLQIENSPLFVNGDNVPWDNGGFMPRRAAISSMGFGGTNFHVVLEEYTAPKNGKNHPVIIRLGGENTEDIKDRLSELTTRTTLPHGSDCQTIYELLSDNDKARLKPNGISFVLDTAEALAPQITSVRDRLIDKPSDDGGISWWSHETNSAGTDKLCIMFPGQGCQFVGMGLELGELFPEAREIFRKADHLAKKRWGVNLSTIIRGHARIGDAEGMALLSKTEYCQPAVLVVSVACYEVWRWLGMKPFCAIGHSLGEYSALVAAGVLEFEEALDGVMERGRLTAKHGAPGTMAAVIADVEVVQNSLKELEGVYLANLNAEQQQVISGSREAIERAKEYFREKRIACVSFPVTGAFHSPLMSQVQSLFSPTLDRLTYRPPSFAIYSNVGSRMYPSDEIGRFAKRTLSEQIVAPVQFVDQVRSAKEAGAARFLEIGPGSVLANMVERDGMRAHMTLPKSSHAMRRFLEAVLSLEHQLSPEKLSTLSRLLSLGIKSVDLSLKNEPIGERKRRSPPDKQPMSGMVQERRVSFGDGGHVGSAGRFPSGLVTPDKQQRFDDVVRIIGKLRDPILHALFNAPKFSLFIHNQANIVHDSIVKTILDTFREHKRSTTLRQPTQTKRLSTVTNVPSNGDGDREISAIDANTVDFEKMLSRLTPSSNIGFLLRQVKEARGPLEKKAEVAEKAVRLSVEEKKFSYNRVVIGGHGPTALVMDADTGATQQCDIWITNHYLGLNRHPKVMQSSADAALRYGTGCGTSAVAGGVIDIHHDLTQEIASLLGKDNAILFSTGFTANFGFLSSILSKHDTIIFDEECHASMIEGILHSGATYRVFRHNDVGHLRAKLEETKQENTSANVFVIIESVYSLSGEEAPVQDICALKSEYEFFLFVDEAHSFGLYGDNGAGLCAREGVLENVDFLMSTLSKATASLGGFVACDANYCELVKYTARAYMFQATLTPADAAAALASLRLLAKDSNIRERLWTNTTYFRKCLIERDFDLGKSVSPIVPVYVPDYDKLTSLCTALFHDGVYSTVIGFPGVPLDKGRLRFIVTANHEREGMDRTVEKLAKHAERLEII